jgi:hypothetical protein
VPPPFVTTADAVARETAWLTAVGDGLPALLSDSGGKWDAVQGYLPRTPGTRRNQIWVLRSRTTVERFGANRKIAKYEFELILSWTLSSAAGAAESDQKAFDAAIDDVLARIGGPFGDKTHGGRFLSVAENPAHVEVIYTPPSQTISSAAFEAHIVYAADDWDFTN